MAEPEVRRSDYVGTLEFQRQRLFFGAADATSESRRTKPAGMCPYLSATSLKVWPVFAVMLSI